MTTVAMLLGLSPIPEKKRKGRTHTVDGRAPRAQNKRADRDEPIAERRRAIKAICQHEPTTALELQEATAIKPGTLEDDLAKMVAAGELKKRTHRSENLYWVPA